MGYEEKNTEKNIIKQFMGQEKLCVTHEGVRPCGARLLLIRIGNTVCTRSEYVKIIRGGITVSTSATT